MSLVATGLESADQGLVFKQSRGARRPEREGLLERNTSILSGPSKTAYASWGKRAFDVIGSVFLLILLTPFTLFLLAIVAFEGGYPIYSQSRVGQGGRRFRILKIRSMRVDAETELKAVLARDPSAAAQWTAGHKLCDDPRVTAFGALLRVSSLDELPQLVNVLRGDMSLVGPRPITAEELPRYGASATAYLSMKPGLTGPWQVSGRNAVSYEERVKFDRDYAADAALLRDLSIILFTVVAVFRRTGR